MFPKMPRWPVRARSAIHLGLGAIAARFVTLLGDFNARGPDLLFALLNHVNCATPVDSGLYSLAGCCISNQRRRLSLELRARTHTHNSVGWTSEQFGEFWLRAKRRHSRTQWNWWEPSSPTAIAEEMMWKSGWASSFFMPKYENILVFIAISFVPVSHETRLLFFTIVL
jgi:hypothetical protein